MNATKLLMGLLVGVLATWSPLRADAPAAAGNAEPTLGELLPAMGANDVLVSQEAQQQWQQTCWELGAPGRDAERTEACRLMTEHLDSKTSVPVRVWLLKQLERIGRDECVDALATALGDESPRIVEAARRALANNPSARAGEELRSKLGATEDSSFKVGLIRALNFRAEPASVAVLGNALRDEDAEVSGAAADALGRIATPEAGKVLAAARSTASEKILLRVGDALLRCADEQLADGHVDEAAAVFRQLSSPQEPAGVRQAAMRGTLQAAGDQAAKVALELLAGDDFARQVAAGYVRELDTDGIKTLAAGLAKLPVAGQLALLPVLGARRDRVAMEAVIEAASSENEQVQVAALAALGGVGDVSTVPMLVDRMLRDRESETSRAADRSLGVMFAEGVDDALLQRLNETQDAAQRMAYLQLLVRRRATVVIPVLLKATSNDDPEVRRLAVNGLSRLASADDVPEMIQAMWSAEDQERDNIEKAIVTICQRITDVGQRAEPVIKAYQKAEGARKNELLLLLGRFGGPSVLEQIRQALSSRDPALFEAGLNGLANWPDGSVADDLLELAKTAKENSHRIRAIRSLARVAVLPSERSEQDRLAMLKEAMGLSERNEERILILNRAAAVRHVDVATFAVAYLEDEDDELSDQAAKTILSIAHRTEIREPNQEEIDKMLKKVIEATEDEGLVNRARSYMAEQ